MAMNDPMQDDRHDSDMPQESKPIDVRADPGREPEPVQLGKQRRVAPEDVDDVLKKAG